MSSDKVCAVCGDKALCKNYTAMTCDSCRAFFRRHAANYEEYVCRFGAKCEINVNTRKKCQKCRLAKCLDIGMRKEWILSEIEKQERTQKIEQKRKQRIQESNKFKQSSDSDSNQSSELITKEVTTRPTSDDTNNSLSDDMIILDQIQGIFSERSDPDLSQQMELDLHSLEMIAFDDSLRPLSGEVNFAEIAPVIRPITDYNNTFNELESSQLTEMITKTKLFTFVCKPKTSFEITSAVEGISHLSLKWDQEIKYFVKCVKELSAFRNMCEDDKITLLKYAGAEISLLRLITAYEGASLHMGICHQMRTGILKLEVLNQVSTGMYEHLRMLLDKMLVEWDMDHNILNLLLFIILFNPNRPQLIHKKMIRLQQQIYMHLLKRYLQLRYRSESEAIARFGRFVGIVGDAYDIHELYVRPLINEQPLIAYHFTSQSPLLKELYDK